MVAPPYCEIKVKEKSTLLFKGLVFKLPLIRVINVVRYDTINLDKSHKCSYSYKLDKLSLIGVLGNSIILIYFLSN